LEGLSSPYCFRFHCCKALGVHRDWELHADPLLLCSLSDICAGPLLDVPNRYHTYMNAERFALDYHVLRHTLLSVPICRSAYVVLLFTCGSAAAEPIYPPRIPILGLHSICLQCHRGLCQSGCLPGRMVRLDFIVSNSERESPDECILLIRQRSADNSQVSTTGSSNPIRPQIFLRFRGM